MTPVGIRSGDKESREQVAEVQRIAKVGGWWSSCATDSMTVVRRNTSSSTAAPGSRQRNPRGLGRQDTHPDDRERAERQFADLPRNGAERYSAKYRIVRPSDGKVGQTAAEARIERDADGQPLRLVGVQIDITERAVPREALRDSEERFRLPRTARRSRRRHIQPWCLPVPLSQPL